MSNCISRLFGISNATKSSPEKSGTAAESPCTPVTALCVGDLVDGPTMLDLVVRVERKGGTVRVTTNRGTTDYELGETVEAYRRTKHSRTGDYHLAPVR